LIELIENEPEVFMEAVELFAVVAHRFPLVCGEPVVVGAVYGGGWSPNRVRWTSSGKSRPGVNTAV
jgi:hypothetical protein